MAEAASTGGNDFEPRDYQIEIFEEACKKNVVACLGTGTGKTFISVMLIKELAHQIKGKLNDGGKRTFFLVTTVPLVYQQSRAIEERTMLKVGKYTGDMGIDFWERDDWKEQFDQQDVLVMTHQILLNMLVHNYLKPSNINLLILDECHHTDKEHPYAKIMERIEECSSKPRVMGLTASIINEKAKHRGLRLRQHLEQRMKHLEIKLRAVCFTCADQSSTEPYVTKPRESIRKYNDVNFNDEQEIEALYKKIKAFIRLQESKLNLKNSCKKFNDIVKHIDESLESLGIWCAYKAALVIKGNIAKDKQACFLAEQRQVLDHAEAVVTKIKSAFETFATFHFGHIENIVLMTPLVTPKVFALMDLLAENKQDLCAIIFVQRRITAQVLSDLINKLVSIYDHYEGIVSDFVYGHNLVELLKGNDTGSCSMTSKNQEKILRRFRKAEFNVLVATSVVEEGLDVRKCNLVVRFDGINNYREYVQSKGRARAKNSQFVVLSEAHLISETSSLMEGMREVEDILIEKSRDRDIPTEEEIEEYRAASLLIEPYRISDEEGAAEVGRGNAMQLLYMYCSKLTSDPYTTLKPIFAMKEMQNYGHFRAVIRMPMMCPLKNEIPGDWLPNKKLAKISAAREACIRLWEMGELDDHFVPIARDEDSDETDEENDESSGTTSSRISRNVYKRNIPKCFHVKESLHSTTLYLYSLEMVLANPRRGQRAGALWQAWYQDTRYTFGLLLAKPMSKLPCFPLFARAGEIKAQVKLLQENIRLSDIELDVAEKFHRHIINDFASDFVKGKRFSTTSAESKALLVALQNYSHTSKKRRRNGTIIDFNFMRDICGHSFHTIGGNYDDCHDAVIKKAYMDDSKCLYYVTEVRDDMKITDKIADNKPTFEEYYRTKYGKIISSKQPLLQSVRADTRLNHISPRFSDDVTKSSSGANVGLEHLIPELCLRFKMPASFHCQSVCLPSFLFRLETMLVAEELRQLLVHQAVSPSVAVNYDDSKESGDCFSAIMRKPKKVKGSQGQRPSGAGLVDQQIFPMEQLEVVCMKINTTLRGSNYGKNEAIKLELILQSLTTVKAKAGFDLERLETLGDSFLKVATSISLFFKYPKKDEGQLTEKRTKLISNKKLLKMAKEKNIAETICNTAFSIEQSGKEEDVVYDNARCLWLPPMFEKDEAHSNGDTSSKDAPCQMIRDKSIADCIEALIGAFFVHDGVDGALKLLKWIGIDCYGSLGEPIKSGSKYADFKKPDSALHEINDQNLRYIAEQYQKMRYFEVEKRINYKFKDKSFLIQALTHMSFYRNRVTDCYQRLEFLGDAVLDFLIIAHLHASNTDLDPSSLTNIKSALVNNNTFALLTIKFGFQKALMRIEPKLDAALCQFSDLDKDEIEAQLKNPFIIRLASSDENEEGFHAPKVLGDIFESLAGAIFLDSGLDFVQVWRVFYPMMQPLIDAYVADAPLNPVRELHEMDANATSCFVKMGNGKVKCTWNIDGKEFSGIGQNNRMAKAAAAQTALDRMSTLRI